MIVITTQIVSYLSAWHLLLLIEYWYFYHNIIVHSFSSQALGCFCIYNMGLLADSYCSSQVQSVCSMIRLDIFSITDPTGDWPPNLCSTSVVLLLAEQLTYTVTLYNTGAFSKLKENLVLWESYLSPVFFMWMFCTAVVSVYITGYWLSNLKLFFFLSQSLHTLSGMVLIKWKEEQFYTDELCFILIYGYILS